MKFKLAVPTDVLTPNQVDLAEASLAEGLLSAVIKNFPDWKERAETGRISGGEIILQKADWTTPIEGLAPGVHLTISLVSFRPARDFKGLATDVVSLVRKAGGFMNGVRVFVQMTLDQPVVRSGTQEGYSASGDGLSLLEYDL
jgi:hypothetical protein